MMLVRYGSSIGAATILFQSLNSLWNRVRLVLMLPEQMRYALRPRTMALRLGLKPWV